VPVVTPLHVRAVLLPDDEVRDLWLVGDRVRFTPVDGATTIASGGFVLPGLVDAHCHLGIGVEGAISTLDEARAAAFVDRAAGTLAIRDAGSPFPYPELDDDPEMPRLARAGRHLAAPKTHIRGVPRECLPDELPGAAAEEARAGNGWVKLVGDWLDRGAADLAPTFAPSVLAAAIDAAHAEGARVAVHTFGEEAVGGLIRAGVDSIEHGTGLSEEDIAEMARRGTVLVPTMINIDTFSDIAAKAEGKFPGYAAHMRALRAGFPAVVRAAYEAGVPIRVGTDAGSTIPHGVPGDEMLMLHSAAGMPALDVLAAASWDARAWLGLPGLVEGGLADLVVYEADPRADLRVVKAPSRIVLRGRVIR
jgi:imidazolonepropionase-like amidohydrolase